MRKGKRKTLDACFLNQKFTFFFFSNPTFQQCSPVNLLSGIVEELMGKVVIYSGQWWIEKSPNQDFSPNLLSMLEAWPSSVQGFYFPSLSNHNYLLTLQGFLLVSFSFFFLPIHFFRYIQAWVVMTGILYHFVITSGIILLQPTLLFVEALCFQQFRAEDILS